MSDLPSKQESGPKTIRGLVSYHDDCEMSLIDGVPLQELGMSLEIGPCTVCGAAPDEQRGGTIENVRVEEGVIMGDPVCLDCVKDSDDSEVVALLQRSKERGLE